MSQTALTENAPLTLDSTCSFRKIWPAYASIRMDRRKETRPDIVADARFLPFRDGVFDIIYCDPPHLVRKSPDLESIRRSKALTGRNPGLNMFTRYGWWNDRKQWIEFVKCTNEEFGRALKVDGELNYKITDGETHKGNTGGATHLRELVEGMSRFNVVTDKMTDSKSNISRSGTKVHWLTMKPKSYKWFNK